jgi:hypothetical protein
MSGHRDNDEGPSELSLVVLLVILALAAVALWLYYAAMA